MDKSCTDTSKKDPLYGGLKGPISISRRGNKTWGVEDLDSAELCHYQRKYDMCDKTGR